MYPIDINMLYFLGYATKKVAICAFLGCHGSEKENCCTLIPFTIVDIYRISKKTDMAW